MKLSAIYERSAGVLTHAERDVYLGYCSFANPSTGFCNKSITIVAGRVGMPRQSCSRAYHRLLESGFLVMVEDGIICLVGFPNAQPSDALPQPDVAQSVDAAPQPVDALPQRQVAQAQRGDAPDSNKEVFKNKDKKEKKKTEDPDGFAEFREKLVAYQNGFAKLTTQGAVIGNNTAIRKLFELARGDTAPCIEIHESLQKEKWRKGRVDWCAVVGNFNFHDADKRLNGNGKHNSNGNGQKPTPAQTIAGRPYYANPGGEAAGDG
jgi:hypothetical protein